MVDEFIVRVRDGDDWYDLGSPRAARALAALLKRRNCGHLELNDRPHVKGFHRPVKVYDVVALGTVVAGASPCA